MSPNIVTVDGAQFYAEDLAEAVETFKEHNFERGSRGAAGAGRYLLIDDGDSFDDAVHVVDTVMPEIVEDEDGASYFMLDALEDAADGSLEAYISSRGWFYNTMDEFVDDDDSGTDVTVKFGSGVVSGDQVDGIMDDDGVDIELIRAEEGDPVVHFSDER